MVPVARLCAPLTCEDRWQHDLDVLQKLHIAALELECGWAAAPAWQVAALAEALLDTGMSVAMAQASPGAITTESLQPLLAALAPTGCRCLLLPRQTPPASVAEAQARFATLAEAAEKHGATVLLQNDPAGWPADGTALGRFVASVDRAGLRACFDPALSAAQKRHPFLTELMPGPLKRYVHVLRLRDAVFSDGSEVLPNEGNAELKELVSALECRGYAGWYALSPWGEGSYGRRLAAAYGAVRSLIESL